MTRDYLLLVVRQAGKTAQAGVADVAWTSHWPLIPPAGMTRATLRPPVLHVNVAATDTPRGYREGRSSDE